MSIGMSKIDPRHTQGQFDLKSVPDTCHWRLGALSASYVFRSMSSLTAQELVVESPEEHEKGTLS
jgi:hypothetical protein